VKKNKNYIVIKKLGDKRLLNFPEVYFGASAMGVSSETCTSEKKMIIYAKSL
jgi:hypothetical protein